MHQRTHYSHCPVCGSQDIHPALKVRDHSVSQEIFEIWQCVSCSLRFTQDIPNQSSIGAYYQSEDYISHSNTSKGIINRLYQMVRKRTMAAKYHMIQKFTGKSSGSLLDVGAGTGSFVSYMKLHGWQVRGLEPDEGARKVALETYNIELDDIKEFENLAHNQFDAISLWHVLEHVHELHPYIQRLKQLVKTEGKIFIAVPNYTSHDADVYKSYWAAYDVPRHLYHFSPKAMHVLMKRNGLKIEATLPMWFDSFYISLLSSKYQNADRRHVAPKLGKAKLVSAFWNGLRSNMKANGDRDRCSSIVYVISKF